MRLTGVPPGARVRVLPSPQADRGHLPQMAGDLFDDGDALCFVPRFPFVEGRRYRVEVDGEVAALLERPRLERPITTEVLGIFPTAERVPRNLLRLYVWFSAPMSEGFAAEHVRLLHHDGRPVTGALFSTEHELWDMERRRLTVLLDPARIKKGLRPHEEIGYPLHIGEAVTVAVDEGFLDARGAPLVVAARRRYEVGDDERDRVRPQRWAISVPAVSSRDPVGLRFDRPMDHALLMRALTVMDAADRRVPGAVFVGPEERSWGFVPTDPWAEHRYHVAVDPVLEDVAGNSVGRVFDRDLAVEGDEPLPPEAESVFFSPHG